MIRTLTFVALLALLAGLAVGFFFAEVHAAGPAASPSPIDSKLEQRVQEYVTANGLSPAGADEVRSAIRDFERSVLDHMHRLRAKHADEFEKIHKRAQERIDAAILKYGR
jgi:hypothetical protein